MPDEEQNNGQTTPTPDELPTPMPRPVEPASEPMNETPAPDAEQSVSEPETMPTELPSSEPVSSELPTPVAVEEPVEAPFAESTAEEAQTPESTPTPESEADSLPPAEAPMPTFGDEEPVTVHDNPFVTGPTVHPNPTPDAPDAMAAPSTPSAKKKSGRKKGIIFGILIAILLLIIGGTASGYFLWYQNPDKVIMDTIVNAIKADSATYKGTLKYVTDTTDVAIDVEGQIDQSAADGTIGVTITPKEDTAVDLGSIVVSGQVIAMKDGTTYVKLNDLQSAYEKLRDNLVQAAAEESAAMDMTLTSDQLVSAKEAYDTFLLPTVKKLDGQWIKTDAAELEDTSGTADDSLSCVSDAFKKAVDDGTFADDIISAYQDNPFLSVSEDLGVQNGSQGYVLAYDNAKADAFTKATEDTQLAKDVMACDVGDEDTTTEEDAATMSQVKRIELWTDQFSHKLTRLVVEAKDDDANSSVTADVTTALDVETSVTAPSDAKTLEEVLGTGTDTALFNLLGTSSSSY